MNAFEIINLSFSVLSAGIEKIILDGISLKAYPGEITVIWGPNGSGKSTTLNATISDFDIIENGYEFGELKITGEIILDGRRIDKIPGYKRAKIISKISQNVLEFYSPSLTLLENFANIYLKHKRKRSVFKKAVNDKDFKEALNELILKSPFPIKNRLNEFITNFSGGEAELITSLALFMSKPKLVLLDEHTKNLDLSKKTFAEQMMVDFIKTNSLCTLWVTHDPLSIIEFADQIIWLKNGKISECSRVKRPIDKKILKDKLIKFQQGDIE